ncbi:wings apart-like protein regulation of heterochromatin-domain-containing protein [Talaromyces proteolyticus]|uniref:Wings apart-like protein regulation of heterochromatin-domain-containing protein n=1 Tax=Talaromyces proteolyticus TaxID=1131652 RepID=A0AAD4Q1V7_9EURO|nr:wings apart-like protein regulation of heterochromatin-domain-containing protein [Talaromyces proteolyticus]KAH8702649.1 wings apart-like protein regulation of heterochromatin-domain-containing protein [Talaromyces proteolyticus]
MDWKNPERRRKIVTYGKSSHNQPEHNRQPARSYLGPDERDTNGLNAPLRSELESRLQTSDNHHAYKKEELKDRNLKEKMPSKPDTSAQDSQRNLRSPKRRKVAVDSGTQNVDDIIKPQSNITANDTHRASSSRLRASLDNTITTDKQDTGSVKSSLRTYSKPLGSSTRSKGYDTRAVKSTGPLPGSMSPSSNKTPGLLFNKIDSQSESQLSQQKRVQRRGSFSTTPAQNGIGTHTDESRTRRRLVDSLGSHDIQEDEDTSSETDPVYRPATPDLATEAPSTPINSESQSWHAIYEEPRARCLANDVAENTASPQTSSPKITYARQRSFLSNIDSNGSLGVDSQLNIHGDVHASSMLQNPAASAEDEHPDASSVRSIHELRRAGVNARFQGIVDSILEDIEEVSNPLSVRRSGLIQLCEKLFEDTFAQRFIEYGAASRLANSMPAKQDVISALLSMEAYALMLRLSHLPSSLYLTFWPKIVATAPTLLSIQEGISKLIVQRRFGLSRVNQATINDVSVRSGKVTGLDHASSPLSPQRLILHCMQLTIRKLRDGDAADVLPVEIVSKLVDLLLALSGHASGHMTDQHVISENYDIFESIISILESYTTSSISIGDAQQDALTSLAASSQFLSWLSEETDARCFQLLTLHLRLILNITNTNSQICERFATPDLINSLVMIVLSSYPGATGDNINEKKDSLDIVILALGALINLTEESEAARQRISSQHKGTRTLLAHLLAVFTEGLDTVSEADSVGQTHSNVAFGYLSILLCTMCLNYDVRVAIKSSLNGTGLNRLLATVEEFLHYHRKVDEELSQSQALGEFTLRLERILNQIRDIGV